MIASKPPKPRTCKACAIRFTPERMGQKVCSPVCALMIVRKGKIESEAIKAKVERRETRAKLNRLKSLSDLHKEAQQAFNAWVRARDAGQPCISCGRHHQGQIHAGHYLSRGAHPELRYEPTNCHAQCAPCNTHLSGNVAAYRIRLIAKIGQPAVDWLEGPHKPTKWTREMIEAVRDEYRAKAKAIDSIEKTN